MEYKVLTLWEPWATLLVHGIKKIETRPKPTKWTIEKGSYLIHSAKKWNIAQAQLSITNPFDEFLEKINIEKKFIRGNFWRYERKPDYLGYIIGSVNVIECCEIKAGTYTKLPFIFPKKSKECYIDIHELELSFGDYSEGRYAWICQNPRILKTPIPYKGGQGYYQNFKGNVNQLEFYKLN